jgi:hypothetical protein
MSDSTPKLRALAFRSVRLVKPSEELNTKATAALGKIDFADVQKQTDLLHIEAVLVSEGINDNDDAFTHAELKRALSSPVLKPMNWQHKDSNILGVMYSVEARDMNGKVLAEVGDEPIELVVQGAVWHHLPHIKATAQDIKKRIEGSTLFVSMECWFDTYDYGFYTSANELFDVIERNNETAFLDKSLKANGGTGKYNGMRIGRALSGINFGGIAFVDRPANKRSLILNSFAFDPKQNSDGVEAKTGGTDQGLDPVTDNVVIDRSKPYMEVQMNDLNRAAASVAEVQTAVKAALDERERAAAAQAKDLELTQVKQDLASAKQTLSQAEARVKSLEEAVDAAFEQAKATAAPAEIARIDQALKVKGPGAGDAVFAAKIAFINQTRASVQGTPDAKAMEKLTEENALLRKERDVLKAGIRQADIEYLFRDILGMEEKEVDVFVKAGLACATDEAFTAWMDEKKLFAKKLAEKMAKKDKKAADQADDAEAGLLSPSDRETPVEDRGAVLRPEHGRAPSDVRRVPRSKLTAASDLEKLFEEVAEPDLAGAEVGSAAGGNPMAKLVASLLGKQTETKEGK